MALRNLWPRIQGWFGKGQSVCTGRDGVEYPLLPNVCWHLMDDMGRHNAYLGCGVVRSIGAGLEDGTLPEGVTTPYNIANRNQETEALWEQVRKREFGGLPSRSNALFLFEREEDVQEARRLWFPNEQRPCVRVRIIEGASLHRADAKWLDAPSEEAARRYWSGDTANNPLLEIVVQGCVYFPDWNAGPPFQLLRPDV